MNTVGALALAFACCASWAPNAAAAPVDLDAAPAESGRPSGDAAVGTSAAAAPTSEPSVLLWAPQWSSIPPRVALRGVALPGSGAGNATREASGAGAAPAPDAVTPYNVWENDAEIPRAVEPFPKGGYFFSDTKGSLWLLDPGKAVHEILPRVADKGVDNSILSLAFDADRSRLLYTVNTTIVSLSLSADGTRAVKPPRVVADFAPRGVQSLVVDWQGGPSGSGEAFYCLFDDENRNSGSLVRAPVSALSKFTLVVNGTLPVLSAPPFGDALPRLALDPPTRPRRVYFAYFAVGVSYVDLDNVTAGPKRVPLRWWSRTSPLVPLSIAVVRPPPGGDAPVLVICSLAGNLGTVPVTGGDLSRVSSPCLPSGGCRYRQLWDMKVLQPDAHAAAVSGSGAVNGSAGVDAKPDTVIIAPWIDVTDLDERRATVKGASVRRLDLYGGPHGNFTAINDTSLYDTTWHRGMLGMVARDDDCRLYWTQNSHSSIFASPFDPLKPVVTEYTYKNFRFNPEFDIDNQRDFAYWFQQYENPHSAGDNGYAKQLMGAKVDDLDGRASLLSSICNSHSGQLMIDPASGDVVFQSYGSGSMYRVQHYCYRKQGSKLARHFYTQWGSYQAVNVAVDWASRFLYVGGTAWRVNESAIRRVSLDTPTPEANPETVVAANTSANAMAFAEGTLFYVQVSAYGQLKFQSNVLYSCKPAARPAGECIARRATNHSAIEHAFSDQFSSITLDAPSDDTLVFTSSRGNSIAVVVSTYKVPASGGGAKTAAGGDAGAASANATTAGGTTVNAAAAGEWSPVWVSPFNSPAAVGGTGPDRVYYVDGTLSTFGAFSPVPDADPFNVPFEIVGRARALSTLGTSQPYGSGVSGRWSWQLTAGEKTWYYYTVSADNTSRLVLVAADMEDAKPKPVLTLEGNASTSFMVVDEGRGELYYVIHTNKRPGRCGGWNGGVADDLVRVPLAGGADPVVVYEQPKGWCFGSGWPALDTKNRKLYYSQLDQYSEFMSNPYLAVLDLATGQSERLDWGWTVNYRRPSFNMLRLSDDAETLWAWACVPNQFGDGCNSRMFRLDVGPNAKPGSNWTNATLGPLGPNAYASGLQDFSVRGQPPGRMVIAAYFRPSTSRPVRGIFECEYVARGDMAWKPLLQPVDVNNVAVDTTDADAGLLVAAYPPPLADYDGVLLLRGPTSGVGRPGGAVLRPTLIPYPSDVPASIRSSNMAQLAHQPPHRLVFAWGRANCMADELWQTTLHDGGTADAPTQLVSALLPPYGGSQLTGVAATGAAGGGYELTWIKCSARVVFATVPPSAPFDAPVDYAGLGHAWLGVDPGPGTSMSTMARVGDDFVFAYRNGAVFHARLQRGAEGDHTFASPVLLRNESDWLPLSSAVHGTRVFIGQRNQTGSNGRVRVVDFGAGGAPSLAAFVADAGPVDAMATAPARCAPPP